MMKPLPTHLVQKMISALDLIGSRMDDTTSHRVIERDGSKFNAEQCDIVLWKRCVLKGIEAQWDDIMYILNVLNKELPQ